MTQHPIAQKNTALNTAPQAEMQEASERRHRLGRVISSTGLQVLVLFDLRTDDDSALLPKIGSNVILETDKAAIVASVSAMSSPTPGTESDQNEILITEVEIIGEITSPKGIATFKRGIGAYPILGDLAVLPTDMDLELIYGINRSQNVRVGRVSGMDDVLATVDAEKFQQGNFAILGQPGAGKSCATVRLIRSFFQQRHSGRVVLFDRHNEYSQAFGNASHLIEPSAGLLPHWLLTFEEFLHILSLESGELSQEEIEILEESIPAAKRLYNQRSEARGEISSADTSSVQLDIPVPYKVADVISYIDKSVHTDNDRSGVAHRRLKARLTMISRDPRFAFIFGRISASDNLAEIIASIFRFPTDGQPITIIDLSSFTIELADVVLSVVTRLSLAVATWSGGKIPILLVLEDAHRFVGKNKTESPLSGTAIGHLMGRGRKLGVNIGFVSSRPRAISEDILEQCGTFMMMRLSNRLDMEALMRMSPETAPGLMTSVSTLAEAEAIGVGVGISAPVRFRFDRLPPEAVPTEPGKSKDPEYFATEDISTLDQHFVTHLVEIWRQNGRLSAGADGAGSRLPEEKKPPQVKKEWSS